MYRTRSLLVPAFAFASALGLSASEAEACGGLFCNSAQPVNQAAEQILFADHGDGTTTAVIQIQYQGSAQNFSWLLPLSTVPEGDDIAVASDIAFQRLQSSTNPLYTLTTRVEGECDEDRNFFRGSSDSVVQPTDASPFAAESSTPPVTVESSGIVGSFEWTVISVDSSLPEPQDAALTWLAENGYDVPEETGPLLGPYLRDGMYLLALKLTKNADVGSIRPIVLTYEGGPSIPIRPTAVAANDDMGVMVYLAGASRGVPSNYLSLELNEARINWFNPNQNYNDVVIEAANEAGGQGFVTEYADRAQTLQNTVYFGSDDEQLDQLRSRTFSSFAEIVEELSWRYQGWSGFTDALEAGITELPEGVSVADVRQCPNCYQGVQYSPTALFDAIEEMVLEPVRRVQDLIDESSWVTRLYTTMSAGDMTVDPMFGFNRDLTAVSNIHTAERIIECASSVTQDEAPWRIEFPQGETLRGSSNNVGVWPNAVASQPANLRTRQLSSTGAGAIVEDNQEKIAEALEAYNRTQPGSPSDCSCSLPGDPSSRTPSPFGAALGALGIALAWLRRRR